MIRSKYSRLTGQFRLVVQVGLSLGLVNGLTQVARADDISGPGWRLWPDEKAAWQTDALYLPSEVDLPKLSVNPPTGGWEALKASTGIPVTLPSTVEEHYWNKIQSVPYTRDVAAHSVNMDGRYLGVSWWWRTIHVPEFKPGQRVIVHVRGARLRSELYCNQKLCGYSIMTELPFDSDITSAVKPGQDAQLALRITNPGGILDWNDFVPEHFFTWGTYTFPASHSFGGLDSGITLEVRDDGSVTDLAAINTPDLHIVHLLATVSTQTKPYAGPLVLSISRDGKSVWSGRAKVSLAAGQSQAFEVDAHVPGALPWTIDAPNLYQASAQIPGETLAEGGKTTNFGFRFFTAEGVEKLDDPYLSFNGKRIVVRSAISWGYWGRNGLWPDEEMARREITAAKALGLNCIQSHRNLSKPEVLDLQDQLGLLRYEEPGSGAAAWGDRYDVHKGATFDAKPGNEIAPVGVDTSGSGPDGDAVEFWEKYEEERILEMVRRDRGHPSLIMYSMQNEGMGNDLRNPRVYRILREIHALDPSRPIILHSGVGPNRGQCLMLPYSDTITYSNQNDLWAGWRDQHSVGGPGNWIDSLYTDPTAYSQKTPDNGKGAISMWGEMLGVGTPDNFEGLVDSFDKDHPTGYDYDDDKAALDATHQFLDTFGFRKAFPTDADYYHAIGNKSYFFWQKIIEQARADNANDYLVISGWESTTIDNHSGLVDNHRFFKGDPEILRRATLPELLVVRPRKFVLAKGEQDLADVFLINETNRTGKQNLTLTVKRPDGSVLATMATPVTAIGGNTFGQLLTSATPFTADAAGYLTVSATLTPQTRGGTVLTRSEQVNVIDPAPATTTTPRIAVLEPGHEVTQTLANLDLTPVPFGVPATTDAPFDVIVFASKSHDPDLDALATGTTVPPAPKGDSKAFDAALDQVQNHGTRLVLFGNGEGPSHWMLQELANRKIVILTDWVQHTGASWFGSWYVVRDHWLFDGLPVNCAMDWRYDNSWKPEQESKGFDGTGGANMTAPGLEVACGYGSNDNKELLGASACVIPYGKGQVVWYCLPQLVMALGGEGFATNHAVAQRLLANAVLHPVSVQ